VKLREVLGETPLQFTLLQKLLQKGEQVTFDWMEYHNDYTRWHSGYLDDIIHTASPAGSNFPETFLIWYKVPLAATLDKPASFRKENVRVNRLKFDRMQLYKHEGRWFFGNRKPGSDDEAS